MTEKLYHDDAYAVSFEARVVDRCEIDGQYGVVLDQTLFYPTSGGQPHDTGVLNDIAVVDVIEQQDHIVHILEHHISDDRVRGEIDWPRRYDHMQQHSGQHILSETFISIIDSPTHSFHMSEALSTIDIERAPDSPAEWDAVDQRLNEIISANHAISAYRVETENVAALNLRKIPDRQGPLRIIDINSVDRTACGGTHCRTTGELGLIQILSRQPRKVHGGLYRIEFVCGNRARADYGRRIEWMNSLTACMETGESDVHASVKKLMDGQKESDRKIKALTEKLMMHEADALAGEIESVDGIPLLIKSFTDRDAEAIRQIARQIVSRHQCVALLGGGEHKMQLVFARSEDRSEPMGTLLQQTLKQIGGRGGGRPVMAMGGVADMEMVQEALNLAKIELLKHNL